MSENYDLSEALENYLEAILFLEKSKGAARVKDIAEHLSVHKSTVTAALKSLTEKGLVDYSPYELARLTAAGGKTARSVTEKHNVIKSFLTDVLFIDDESAAETACRMEHVVDRTIVERFRKYREFVSSQDAVSGLGAKFESLLRRES